MKFRNIAKSLRHSCTNPFRNVTYVGVHASFSEVRQAYRITSYHTKSTLRKEELDAKTVAANFRSGVELALGPRQNFFKKVVQEVRPKGQAISVLDIGAGSRPILLYQTLGTSLIRWSLNDTPEIMRIIRQNYNFLNVEFEPNLLNLSKVFDLAYLGSSLQYFENWEEILWKISINTRKHLVISDTPFGSIDTFACAQVNVWPRILCRWVFNIVEVQTLMTKFGFELIHQEKMPGERRFHNYPLSYQEIDHWNLLFSRTHSIKL